MSIAATCATSCGRADIFAHWWFSIGGDDFHKADCVHNPWTAGMPTAAERRLHEHRRNMRDQLREGGYLRTWMELEEARYLYDAEHYDEAELVCLDYIDHHGDNATAANLLGLICSVRGNHDEMVSWLKIATELQPGNAILRGNYGSALVDAGRDAEGEAEMRSALALDPDLRYIYTMLGDLYRKHGDEKAAHREFREAIRLVEKETCQKPDSASIWRSAESLYRRVGDYERANAAQRQAAMAEQNERFGADHSTRIAGPDSGFLPADETT